MPAITTLLLLAISQAPAPPTAATTSPQSTPVPEAASPASTGPVDVTLKAGEGVTFSTTDAALPMQLNVRGRLMLLGTMGASPDDTVAVDVVVRRARLVFSGFAFDPRLRYRLQLAVAPADLQEDHDGVAHRSPLLDAIVEFAAHRDLHLKAGQFVLRHNRSRLVSSSSMQLVDRSLGNAEFNLDRDVAVELSSRDLFGVGRFRYALALGVGEGRDSVAVGDAGFLYLGRVEAALVGPLLDDVESDLARDPRLRIMLGTSYGFTDRSPFDKATTGSAVDGVRFSAHHATADLTAAMAGLWATAEVQVRRGFTTLDKGTTDPGARSGASAFVQLGTLLPFADVEVAGRYGMTAPLETDLVARQQELGVGVAAYFFGHAVKIHGDLFEVWSGEQLATMSTRGRLMTQVTF